MSTLLTILLVGLLIALHELGHFLFAKLAGVRVLCFSVGFGPRLAARRFGETEYRLSLIPLGGYVQLQNEPPQDADEALRQRGRSLAEKPPGRRAMIFAAGPAMNLLLPFLLLPLIYLIGHDVPAYQSEAPVIGHVVADSAASRAGILPGDHIRTVDGIAVATWQDLAAAFDAGEKHRHVLLVERRDETVRFELDKQGDDEFGLRPRFEAVIDRVFPGTPADAAGLRDGDRIVAVNGQPVDNWYAFSDAIDRSDGQALQVGILREGSTRHLQVLPSRESGRYMIGVSVAREMTVQKHGLVESLRLGAERSIALIRVTVGFIGSLFSGQVDTEQIGGPVAVFQMTDDAVQSSLVDTLFVLAFLSIQLGVLNLLPVPVLDGGHLLLLIPEFFLRRPVPQRLREGLQGVGLFMVLGLMVLAFYNDISRLL